VAGAIQWLVLRQQIHRAGWWVFTSTVGGAVAWFRGWTEVVFAVGGAVAGVITGPVLIWLLRHLRSEVQFVAGDTHRSPGRD
jgi:hypothetical protein